MGQPNIYWAGTPNYTSGNYGIVALFPHWTCGGFDGSVATLQNPDRQASAHYVIEGERVAQLVDESDSAWHCGNYYYNMRAISYELVGWPGNPPSYDTLDTCARLMAQASKRFFGGAKLVLGENVMLHKWVSSTDCPGETDIDWLVARANEFLHWEDNGLRGVHTHTPNQTDAQRWKFEDAGDGLYLLRNVACGKCLMLNKELPRGDGFAVCAGPDDKAARWDLIQLREGQPLDRPVMLVADGLYLDVVDGSLASGAGMQARSRSASTHGQKFALVWAGQDSTYFIHNLESDMCVDVDNGGRI